MKHWVTFGNANFGSDADENAFVINASHTAYDIFYSNLNSLNAMELIKSQWTAVGQPIIPSTTIAGPVWAGMPTPSKMHNVIYNSLKNKEF
ncbi:MAG: hypothetical protein A3F11_07210 [Gammaproteobacteria bacterium RIFCSPHIGHO2_12_FULL_37_14]|nr:MAG: hypothetical protein A3F11_07210 [Gammaproteobacteria bacterium RIFCSPHIGHO2_12_FULL_37_14]